VTSNEEALKDCCLLPIASLLDKQGALKDCCLLPIASLLDKQGALKDCCLLPIASLLDKQGACLNSSARREAKKMAAFFVAPPQCAGQHTFVVAPRNHLIFLASKLILFGSQGPRDSGCRIACVSTAAILSMNCHTGREGIAREKTILASASPTVAYALE